MVNLFNNFSSPYDDLVNRLGASGQNSQQNRRKLANNPNITVKEVNKSSHHEIQIFNRPGYRNFKIEVVKQGQDYYLAVESPADRFEKFFKLNPSNDDLQNINSQIIDDWLVITIPKNVTKKQAKATPKKQTNESKKQTHESRKQTKSPTPAKSPPPTKNTPTKSNSGNTSNSRTKSPPPPSNSTFSKGKGSTKNLFSRGKKSNREPPSLLEAARRRPFLEEITDPGI